jgi:hypothetical protein
LHIRTFRQSGQRLHGAAKSGSKILAPVLVTRTSFRDESSHGTRRRREEPLSSQSRTCKTASMPVLPVTTIRPLELLPQAMRPKTSVLVGNEVRRGAKSARDSSLQETVAHVAGTQTRFDMADFDPIDKGGESRRQRGRRIALHSTKSGRSFAKTGSSALRILAVSDESVCRPASG